MNSKDFLNFEQYCRYDLINFLIELYDYKSYLEIGVDIGANFEKIRCPLKYGVDPNKKYEGLTHNMTSDEFFAQNKENFDIIFIDGLHISDQVIVDIKNSLNCLRPKGTIVMHDCLPVHEEVQRQERLHDHWNGDVWKAFAHYRSDPNLFMMTVNTDEGLGFIKKAQQITFELPEELDFDFYAVNAFNLMNVKSVLQALNTIRELHSSGF